MSNEKDLDAINDYFKRTVAVTPEANQLKSSWLAWFPTIGWYDKRYSQDVRDEASTRRNKFNLANAVTPKEKELVVQVITKGMDTNQMQGGTRRETLPTGEVGTQIKKPSVALTGTHPTIKQGSTGPAVIEWQKFLGTTADGKFGPNTTALTKAFQKKNGLKDDGVVGNMTWTKALGAPPVEAVAPKEAPGIIASLFSPTPAASPKASTPAVLKPAIKIPPKVTAKPGGAQKPVAAAPTSKSSAAPSKSSGTVAVVKETVKTAQAGMFSSLAKLPMWAKVAGVAATVAAVMFGRGAKTVNYSSRKEVKRRRAA